MALHTRMLSPAIGSLVLDVDLADPVWLDRNAADLRRLWLEREVVFFRDQHLTPDQQLRLASVFGPVQPVSSTFPSHPDNDHIEILESKGVRTGTDLWHADLTWQPHPPAGACLLAVRVPEAGGDTLWASMGAAFDSLAPDMKAYLRTLTGVHNWEGPEIMAGLRRHDDFAQRYERMRLAWPPVDKPVVKVHPETGRESLDVNSMYTTQIVGASRTESASLIAYLSSLATVPEWQVRFHWEPGSIAVWDNRAVQHYAANDYHPFPRLMHRVTIG